MVNDDYWGVTEETSPTDRLVVKETVAPDLHPESEQLSVYSTVTSGISTAKSLLPTER
ncbi:hypothetical protein [Halorussus ruber]|uniref:hypothetical protein n=1 Tax=Halorussus ruber TaxID=1126238 RepID=UPI00143D5EFC|nr:hypothetical protein [Halorussus ruber]